MTIKHLKALTDAYNALGEILDAEEAAVRSTVESIAGPLTPEMTATMDAAADLPPGAVIPIGTTNVRPSVRPQTVPSAAPAAAAVDGAPSPIIGVCNATRGCGTLIADDNRNASGALVCPRCAGPQK